MNKYLNKMSIIKLVIQDKTTAEEAIQLLDKSGIGFLPVVDSENILVGVITDGDIRRSILNGAIDLEHIINKNPRKLPSTMHRLEIIRRLKEVHLRHMPLVDKQGKLVDVVCLENLIVEPKSNKVVIMAGGLGSRLGELTKNLPKPLLPIGGKPILERIIEDLKLQGFSDFTFCLNYKGEMIRQYFGNGEKYGVKFRYTFEEKRLGTAGALSLLEKSNVQAPMLVMNADVISNVDFSELLNFHAVQNSQATMCIKPQEYEIPFACVNFDDGSNLVELAEKPKIKRYVNSGMYILNPEVLEHVPHQQFYDMPTLFQDLMQKDFRVKVFHFQEFWIDIGIPEDYMKMRDDYLS